MSQEPAPGRGPATGPAARPSRVLYVGGVPRSGSTLTDLMLSQLPGHVGVGELFYLWVNGPRRDVRCGCGDLFSGCEFWQAVGRSAYGGWSPALVDEALRLQSRVDRTDRIALMVSPLRPPAFAADLERYRQLVAELYRAILEVSGDQVVVDSSKRPSLAFLMRGAEQVDLRVAHVVRDPRGVAYSWSKQVTLPDGASHRTEMPRWSTSTVTRRWVTVNAAFAALERLGVPRAVVRYEDLVARPAEELVRIAALHGVTATAADLTFVRDGELVRAVSHTVAGSRIRLSTGPMRLRTDEEWRRQLPDSARRLVEVGTWWSRGRYGYR